MILEIKITNGRENIPSWPNLSVNPILPGGGVKYTPSLFFLHHPKTAQDIKLKLSDFKDTLLRHILQVKPVR